jgi:uncharacterized protein YpmS
VFKGFFIFMKKLLVLMVVLILASLACQLPGRAASIAQPTIVVSKEAAGEVENQLATAAADLNDTGLVTVVFTESQLTSYITEKIADQPDNPIQNPQVLLRDGTIEVTGKAKVGILSTVARLVLEPFANQGNLGVDIREAKLGSLPFPDSTLESISQTLNQNLNDLITVRGDKFYLETISVNDGTLTLSGRLQ